MSLPVALVGCGHMGAHHASVIRACSSTHLSMVVDSDASRAEAAGLRWGVPWGTVVPRRAPVVVIATPASSHRTVLGELTPEQWVLVEKPVVCSLDELTGVSRRVIGAHSERFNPATRAVRISSLQTFTSRRQGTWSGRGGDVDVVLDLLVHDLDLLAGWTGAEILQADVVGRHGPSGHVDEVDVTLHLDDGVTARLWASRMAKRARRQVELVEHSGAHWSLDMLLGRVRCDEALVARPDGRDALTAQWDAFLKHVRGDQEHHAESHRTQRVLRWTTRIQRALLCSSAAVRRAS